MKNRELEKRVERIEARHRELELYVTAYEAFITEQNLEVEFANFVKETISEVEKLTKTQLTRVK